MPDPLAGDVTFDELVGRAENLASRGRRRLLGITGPPGAGKSTLAIKLVEALGARAVRVDMDGFHLAQRELRRLGRIDRKGAADTFDGCGYVELLRRLRHDPTGTADVVYAPEFRRDLEEPIAGAIAVPPSVPLVVTEGNYLLLTEPPWNLVRDLLDEVWYLALPEDERLRRLVARHQAFGSTADEATRRAFGSDRINAERIAATAARADRILHLVR